MSTTYSSTTKDATKDSGKDKDSTDTYVRSADTTETTKTGNKGGNKSTTFESNANTTDKSHDQDSSNSYGFAKDSSNKGGLSGYGSQQQYGGQRSGQFDQDNDQFRRGSQQQQDVQQKLKEVGSLLQKAGHLLQDLQGSSPSDFQQGFRSNGGNYSGPFGGFDSHRSGQCDHRDHISGPCSSGQQQWNSQHPSQSNWSRPSGEWSQYESQHRGPNQSGRWNEDREERGMSGRSGFGSSRNEDRYNIEGGRSVDRYGGFGGPNRPDLAYGQQYGQQGQQYGLGYRGDREEGFSRRGGDVEFSSIRRGADRM